MGQISPQSWYLGAGFYNRLCILPTMESTNPHQDYRVEPILHVSGSSESASFLEVHVTPCQQFTRQRGSTLIIKVFIDSTISSRGRYISIKNEHLTMNARHIYNIYMYIFTHIHTTHIYNHIHLQIYVHYIYIYTRTHIHHTYTQLFTFTNI